jgi:hypothetical protein
MTQPRLVILHLYSRLRKVDSLDLEPISSKLQKVKDPESRDLMTEVFDLETGDLACDGGARQLCIGAGFDGVRALMVVSELDFREYSF